MERRGRLDEIERARLAGCLLGGAILAAPFLALLYDATAGIVVMTLALGATAFGAAQTARTAGEPGRRRLRAAAVVNALLALGCAAALAVGAL